MTVDAEMVAERLSGVRDRLLRVGGEDVIVVAVTKGFGADAVLAAAACGLTDVGESYAQETVSKFDGLAVDVAVHFVGRLQRNKVRKLAGLVDVWQSVDRADLIDEIAKRAPGSRILLQVDISGEDSKGGCQRSDLDGLLERATDAGLEVAGLMGIGPLAEPEAARHGFRRLRELVDRHGLAVCSMGMTDDLEVAVEEGSTMIRVGTALFGPRPAKG